MYLKSFISLFMNYKDPEVFFFLNCLFLGENVLLHSNLIEIRNRADIHRATSPHHEWMTRLGVITDRGLKLHLLTVHSHLSLISFRWYETIFPYISIISAQTIDLTNICCMPM
jgi:hypothetical protein